MTTNVVYKHVIIERDTMTKISKLVAPWEVPIYRSQYGDEKVEILDKDETVPIDELPDAQEEYNHLRQIFGTDPDTKQSLVELVYGRGEQAVKALEAAIKASVAGDIEAAQKVVDGKAGVDADTKKARKDAYADPLAA